MTKNKHISVFRKLAFFLNIAANFVANIISFIYAWHTIGLPGGLFLAGLTFASNMIVGSIVDYNTTLEKKLSQSGKNHEQQVKRANLFLWVAIPSMFISSVSIAVSAYTSTGLLCTAMAFSLSASAVFGLSLAVAMLMSASSLAYAIVQTYEMFQRITLSISEGNEKENVAGKPVAILAAPNSPKTTENFQPLFYQKQRLKASPERYLPIVITPAANLQHKRTKSV